MSYKLDKGKFATKKKKVIRNLTELKWRNHEKRSKRSRREDGRKIVIVFLCESVIVIREKKKQLIETNIEKVRERTKNWKLSTTQCRGSNCQQHHQLKESCTSQKSSMNINPNWPM